MRRTALVLALALAGALAGGATAATAATKSPAPLRVLVSDDDGVKHPGLDQLVRALRREKRVRVIVSAPAGNRSGTGSSYVTAPLRGTRTTTARGVTAYQVFGYPADSITWAFDHLFSKPGTRPDLVISGINLGPNLGDAIEQSGTVGAARTGAAHGVPGVAFNFGIVAPSSDYAPAVRVAIRWLRDNRGRLSRLRGRTYNVNVPSCSRGKLRGMVEMRAAPATRKNDDAARAIDCSRKAKRGADDFDAYLAGYATIARIPTRPAQPPQGFLTPPS